MSHTTPNPGAPSPGDPSASLSSGPLGKIRAFLEMIKVSHTVFALPFAVGATFLAAEGVPEPLILAKIILAVLFARTAAMSFNRVVDRRIDAANPRTRDRALVTGALSLPFVIAATGFSVAAFVGMAAWINTLALALSPVALAVILGYSLAKRFTRYCHLVLGLALAIAPLGAWVAVRGSIGWEPCVLGAAVLLWTAGFDIIYACLDASFDRDAGLASIPASLGVRRALRLSAALHAGMLLTLTLLWWFAPFLGTVFLVALFGILLLLVYEHGIVNAENLSRVNRSFFTTNAIISFVIMTAMIVDVTWPW